MAIKVKIQDVSKTYGKTQALDHVTINIEEGTIHGIIGENGAGKTTLIKALTGIHALDSGTLAIDDEVIYENPKIKQKIGYVADQNQYFKSYRIEQLIAFYQEVYPQFSRELFDTYNASMEIDTKKRIRQLSKGMKMRLSIMLNLAAMPEVLVLDEPTSGLDVIAKKKVLGWIVEAVEARNMTVLIASHHLSELEKLCDSLTMIDKGRVTHQASVDAIKENVCKLQVVFNTQVPEALATWEGIKEVKHIGSVYNIVIVQHQETIIKQLEACGVKLMERIPLTLEEAFIYMNH